MIKNFIIAILIGVTAAGGAIYLYSDGHEYTMDYYIQMHEWDKHLSPAAKQLVLTKQFTPEQAIRAEEQWRLFGVKTKQFRFIERWPAEDDWRLFCYRVSFIDSAAKLFFWTPKYYDDIKVGTVIKTRYVE